MSASKRTPRQTGTVGKGSASTVLTEHVEDYLKAIYTIEEGGSAAATNDIAARLQVAAASVSGMVRRLSEQGLLSYERYRGVRLTEAGRRAALRTIRRHRVIEAYLNKALSYEWDRVHDEAERLEHSASDELVDRMAAAIGEPLHDPHGHPIPGKDGSIAPAGESVTLSDVSAGQTSRVQHVSDEDSELLRYLAEIGIRPGAVVTLTARAPFDGPLTLRIGRHSVQVGTALASRVVVEIVDG